MSDQIRNEKIRNIAIIAHVDHGKTTLVDAMFRQAGIFREGAAVDDRVMDSMDLEKERGITIAAKNCEVLWKDTKINILDTPGHADFGGEVERALSMVDGVVLLVDSAEGPLPQTRFVLSKALEAGLALVVVINKIDRQDSRPQAVLDEITDLLIDLDADEEQLEFPLLYAIGRDGIAQRDLDTPGTNLHPLMDTILERVPGPLHTPEKPFQMMVADLSYSEYLGRMAIGRIQNGSISMKDKMVRVDSEGSVLPLKISRLQVYEGISLKEVPSAEAGDIVILSGLEAAEIGDTICNESNVIPLPRITVDEPTVSMRFTVNSSPFAGQDGKHVQSTKLQDRLQKETLLNVSLQYEEAEDGDGFIVKGRGEFQLAILIETMRREGFELCVGRPHVIFHYEDGKKLEPIEHLMIDCEEEFSGIITEKLSARKGIMNSYTTQGPGRIRLEFLIPSRSLIGYRDEFLTDTKGTGIMNSRLENYEEYKGDLPSRSTGSLVSDRQGDAIPYALFGLEPRGKLLVQPGEKVYEGMVVGIHNRDNDLNVNACRMKQLTNVRASGKDSNVMLTPVLPMTLEKAMMLIAEDEMIEVTPNIIRLRKTHLSAQDRKVRSKKK